MQGAPPRFVCDEMLLGLARWLRAAGYDTVVARRSGGNRSLVEAALAQGRWLLSRDRKLLEVRDAESCVRLLPQGPLSEWVCSLNRGFALDWQHLPLSRCLRCNTPLEPANASQQAEIPPRSRAAADTARWCPGCRQVFWEGSHSRRMRRQLARWDRLCRP